jgi:YVTN family beta-propeller protein
MRFIKGIFILALIVFSFLILRNTVYPITSSIPLESNPRGIAINPITDIAVVANEKADSVSIIDLNTHAVLSTISVGKAPSPAPDGTGPRGVAIDRELNLAVVGSSHDNTISVIDLTPFYSPLIKGGIKGGCKKLFLK